MPTRAIRKWHSVCVLVAVVCGCAPKIADPIEPTPDTEIYPHTASANDLLSTKETVTEIVHDVDPEKTNTFQVTAATRSIWDGVYTEQQRQRGAATYASACARCHEENLEGTETVPALVGDEFIQRWKRKRAGNLFSYMKAEMPPKKKRTAPEYADILAFLLSRNDAPSGKQELAHTFIELQAVRMDKSD